MAKYEPRAGDLVSVTWHDCCGFINTPLSDVKLAVCESIGFMVSQDDKCIIICTSLFTGEPPVGDFSAIPTDWCQEIEVIKKKACPRLI